MQEDLLVDIWLGVKEYLDKRHIEAVAAKYVGILADNGVNDQTLKAMLNNDDELDRAIEYVTADPLDDEDEVDESYSDPYDD